MTQDPLVAPPLAYRALLLLSLLVLALPLCAQTALETRLTARQQAWIASHPTIQVGVYEKGWPPLETVSHGRAGGLGMDYLKQSASRLGLRIQVVTYPDWERLSQAICRGEIDLVMNVSLSASRTRCMVFTRAYLTAPTALVVPQHTLETGLSADLHGQRLVVERGFITEELAAERYPNARLMRVADTTDALQAVRDGQADAYLGQPNVAQRIMQSQGLTDLALVQAGGLPVSSLHFGIANAQQPLAEALDAALASLPIEAYRATRERWLPPLEWATRGGPRFTLAERAALATPLRAAIPLEGVPLSFMDKHGQPAGLIHDYLTRFQAAGAHLEMVPVQDWTQLRQMLSRGEIDVVFGMPIEPSEPTGWVFSAPMLSVSNVIVARQGSQGILGLRDLNGRRVATSPRQQLARAITMQAPDARLVPTTDTYQALLAVSQGRADAFVGNLALVDHLLRTEFSGRLAVVAPTHLMDQIALTTQPRHAALTTAFNKMLDSMSQREREGLQSDWISVQYQSGITVHTLLEWVVPLALILLTAGIFHSVSYRRVRREVQQRRQAEQKLAEVTSNLPAIVFQATRTANGQLSLPFIVGDINALFGVSAEVAMQDESALFARVHPQDQPLLTTAIIDSARDHTPIEAQFRALAATGHWNWIRIRAVPHEGAEGQVHWNGYWVDITVLHEQAQALSEAKAQAEAAAAAKADFLAMMSHEIRTPMAGIVGMLQVLEATPLDGEQQRILTIINESSQMLRQILDDILDFSKMEAGAVTLQPAPVALRELIDSVLLIFHPQAQAKGVELTAHVDPQLAACHLADATRLRQILFNLISNSLKFSDRGCITVDVRVLQQEAAQQQVTLAVSDQGRGIAEDQQARLFQPFFQAEHTHGRMSGTGLGLSICKRLVNLMNGQITLWSSPGKGTRIELQLPLAIANSPVPSVDPAPAVRLQGQVLLVEDHPTNQELLRWQMDQLGLEAQLVDNAYDALLALQRRSFDLVLTDCRMPGMSGYELVEEIRQRNHRNRQGGHLPVIALTASALADEVERCQRAGMDACLTKPIGITELRAALAVWLVADRPAQKSAGVGSPSVEQGQEYPDRSALANKFGSDEVALRLIRSLLDSLARDLPMMDQALAEANRPALAERLHMLAGALGTVSALNLANTVRQLSTDVHALTPLPYERLRSLLHRLSNFETFLKRQLDRGQ